MDAKPGPILRLQNRLGMLDAIELIPFHSYGTPHWVHLRGRVIESKGIQPAHNPSVWRNIKNTLRRLESDEIPGALIRAHFQGKHWEVRTDHEGYFLLDLNAEEPLQRGWHEVELELAECLGEPLKRFVREKVLIPSENSEFAIVSDVDDTIIRTHSTNLSQMVAVTLSRSAKDRVAFPGIPAFYRALSRGPDDAGENPIFYVSKSGWNLYDLLMEFMDLNRIPLGPMFLRDMRVLFEPGSFYMGSREHKFRTIDTLLRTYETLPFILIGDSGMKDPELYERIVRKHPGRVKAVYIHDVTSARRDREVQKIISRLKDLGVDMLARETTREIAEHAAEHGFISPYGLEQIEGEVERQRSRRTK